MSEVDSYTTVRAPLKNGEVVVSPNRRLPMLVSANKRLLQNDFPVGRSNANAIRQESRAELLNLAAKYTRQYAPNITIPTSPETIFVSGHQPEFFHPGVWFKNFLLYGLAKKHNGISINLVIDNDECKSTSITVPAGSMDNPKTVDVLFDQPGKALPFENRYWSETQFAKIFQGRVQETFSVGHSSDLLLDQIWPRILPEIKPSLEKKEASLKKTLGQSVAQARHQVEIANKIGNLEVPLSQICRGKGFQQFLSAILQSADRFHATYNAAIQKFRTKNKIRSKTRPVPELVRNEQWIELPFWIWTGDSPERGPLYIRCESVEEDRCQIFLSDLDSIKLQLRSDALVDELSKLANDESNDGITIRPRALITTMFARLFLSDVFIHGIGGAKYDELTDEIIREFFKINPPQFLTATSTNWLPIEFTPPDTDEIASAKQRVRETIFHPENSENKSDKFLELANRKSKLLSGIPQKRNRKQWHSEISSVNQQLSELNSVERKRAESELNRLINRLRISKILCSREYSILLHPVSLIQTLSEQVEKVLIYAD